ncbi:MAG TPA: phospholipase D-like domain-containing protein [Allosphingosinicella sp.]|nr:phospholipase D-like domain-containing protein [Allosphingosinicella sp.]
MPDETSPQPASIIQPGHNCWRVEKADRLAFIVDAADYYEHIASAMERARSSIFIAGWDFDTRISLSPTEDGGGEPLGHFLLRLVRSQPGLVIRILKWNVGAFKQFLKAKAVYWLFHWWRARRIDFRFDAAHPFGCSHHQKIVVIDECLAACGGIDITAGRWDTPRHVGQDRRRVGADGKPCMPWHDATMLMCGDVALALHDLVSARWKVVTKEEVKPREDCEPIWPPALATTFEAVEVAISRTRAAYKDLSEIRESEAMYIDMIAAAQDYIYLENQYFTSGKIAAAIATRVAEPDPPEIVLIMPRTADGWLEQKAMDGARAKLVQAIRRKDHRKRFRIYVPVTEDGQDIYVHAKVSIVDGRLLRVGSSNLNNRSMGLDSECDIILDAARAANAHCRAGIEEIRLRLLAEHLGCSIEDYEDAESRAGSMIAAIEEMLGTGKTLDPLEVEEPGVVEEFIADNELLDPESADQMFEATTRRGLARSWSAGRARLKRNRHFQRFRNRIPARA